MNFTYSSGDEHGLIVGRLCQTSFPKIFFSIERWTFRVCFGFINLLSSGRSMTPETEASPEVEIASALTTNVTPTSPAFGFWLPVRIDQARQSSNIK